MTGSKTVSSCSSFHTRLTKDKRHLYSVVFVQGKRYRVSNGKKFGFDLHPNKEPVERRLIVAQELQLRIHQALHEGWGQQPTSERCRSFKRSREPFKKKVKPTYQGPSTIQDIDSSITCLRTGQAR